MNDNENQTQPQDDILSFESGTVDRSTPLLPEGVYDLELKSIERKTNDKKQTESLHCTFVTTRDSNAVDGSALHKGWPIRHYIGLTPGDKRTVDQIRKDVVRMLDGLYGKGTNKNIMPLDAHVGKIVTAKLAIDSGDENFGPSNRIKSFVPPMRTM